MTTEESADLRPVVLRISPMAHLAVAICTLGLLIPVLALPFLAPLLVLPVLASAAIVRRRTVADTQSVTARTLLRTRRVEWSEIEGLLFEKGSAARAELKSGERMALPAVTFSTLPQLAAVSGGRVPNPYG